MLKKPARHDINNFELVPLQAHSIMPPSPLSSFFPLSRLGKHSLNAMFCQHLPSSTIHIDSISCRDKTYVALSCNKDAGFCKVFHSQFLAEKENAIFYSIKSIFYFIIFFQFLSVRKLPFPFILHPVD